MKTTSYENLASHLRSGRVYRRGELLSFSKALDRDLNLLTTKGVLEKLGPGLYYKPTKSSYGLLPPNNQELVKSFLKDDDFLLYSWNQYNSLGLGLTQLYNQPVVYNHKRHGIFKLGNKTFDFRMLSRGFPKKLTPEFLLVDLLNNLNELAEDIDLVNKYLKKNIYKFNIKKIKFYSKKYGKVRTKKFLENLVIEK